ncbi:MAG TPA: hypothetical protein VF622_10315, partial [Segetibacter sp.]
METSLHINLEDIKQQLEITKTLKENNPSLIPQIAPLEDKIYNTLIAHVELLHEKGKTTTDPANNAEVYNGLIKEFDGDQKKTRRLSWVNLFLIIGLMIAVLIVIVNVSFSSINALIKPYLEAENKKNRVVELLTTETVNVSNLIVQNLNSLDTAKSNLANLTKRDSLLRKSLNTYENTIKNIDGSNSGFTRIEGTLLYYLILSILALVVVMSITFYLVKVFVNIHRYNNILADHYEALYGTFKLMKEKNAFPSDLTLENAYQL